MLNAMTACSLVKYCNNYVASEKMSHAKLPVGHPSWIHYNACLLQTHMSSTNICVMWHS